MIMQWVSTVSNANSAYSTSGTSYLVSLYWVALKRKHHHHVSAERQKYLGQDEKIFQMFMLTLNKLFWEKESLEWCKTGERGTKRLEHSFHFLSFSLDHSKAHFCKGRLLLVRQAPPAGKNPIHRHFSSINFFYKTLDNVQIFSIL